MPFIWLAPSKDARKNFTGYHFWDRGYWVSTVGKDEEAVRQYTLNRRKKIKGLINSPYFRKNKDL